MSRPVLRLTLVLLLGLTLLTPWAATAQPRGTGLLPVTPGAEVLIQAWGLLSSLWAKGGCGLDPSGTCLKSAPPLQGEEGCGLDPDGRCLRSTTTQTTPLDPGEGGCGLDPNGLCVK